MYHTCKEALTIVNDVLTKTVSTPLPPPMENYDPPPPMDSARVTSRPAPVSRPPPSGSKPHPPNRPVRTVSNGDRSKSPASTSQPQVPR